MFKDTEEESPPYEEPPQVITDPSVFTAAKAKPVEYTVTTPLDMFNDTEEESPEENPQVTTDPSVFTAAKAFELRKDVPGCERLSAERCAKDE